ncbi:hypothetical protein P153DRAFT_174268 [Dothidotthia symphoricarpi CBS 119687]|uniref:Uncharacterized protein n=1 Tax=Dothidotthia symphoricarpi CBS 119687 TaxID=1392245 RepID=A0A6A6ANV2_9PLEO|nr:uncharacterized protein P153DRAFT_174268 [Dothidotthia symphoricarpi CBS 119687]KAF2132818.1 hypothetical protein P153DRAFT_174268 [Dothidotthia symphoricarpi CBS 119687]
MIHQCVIQPQTSIVSAETHVLPNLQHHSMNSKAQLHMSTKPGVKRLSAVTQVQMASSTFRKQPFRRADFPVASDEVATNVPAWLNKVVLERSIVVGKAQELMLHTISQMATAKFESTSMEIFAQDGFMMDDSGGVRSKTFVYSKNLRQRVCHQSSSFQTPFGCVWVRTTTIHLNDHIGGTLPKSQSVTSIVLYPATWIQRLGFKNGLEAIIAMGNKNCLFTCRLTLTRAVPEDSLIFELCRTGQTRAVKTILNKGIGSVVDTSPKGWKPLHFAAAGGHVDLCAMLIREGADKTALVYEGPTPSILSPISIFVASANDLHAEVKISMLRLFSDCIDIADPDDDGWAVHEWLKKAYAKEKVPVSRNSIIWLLHLTAKEEYVVFGARTLWCGIQHAIRSLLNHERHSRSLNRILGLTDDDVEATSRTHADAIGLWLALGIGGRKLLPMVVDAGSFFQMKGFDWVEDDITQSQVLKALPGIYAAWCHALIDCVEKVEEYMQLELEYCVKRLGWQRNAFLNAISRANTLVEGSRREHIHERVCTHCKDDYSALGFGLVEPAQIAITECIRTNHKSKCACPETHEDYIDAIETRLPIYCGSYYEEESDPDSDSDSDEEFFDAESDLTPDSHYLNQHPHLAGTSDIFLDTATILYRSHGRVWIGEYKIGQRFCATCLLLQEQYISKDDQETDFPPTPESYEGIRIDRHLRGAFDVEPN